MVNLAIGLKSRGVSVVVAAFYADGVFRTVLNDNGVTVLDLRKKSRWNLVGPVWRFFLFVKNYRPDYIYSFIGVEIFSLVAKLAFSGTKLIWGVRASLKNLCDLSFLDRAYYSVKPALSSLVDGVISNSEAGKLFALKRGYRKSGFFVVDNGIDVIKFQFNSMRRAELRNLWRVSDQDILVGMVARIVRDKDYECFISSIKLLYDRLGLSCPKFVIVGDGDAAYIEELKRRAHQIGVSDRLIWAGYYSDVAAVYSALDIYCLASKGEGFPNTVAEAMSCGLPIVVSDVGDCRRIVGRFGKIVQIGSSAALAQALFEYAIDENRPGRNEIRDYVVDNFSVDRMVEESVKIFRKIGS